MATKENYNGSQEPFADKKNKKKVDLSFQPVSEIDNQIGQYSIVFNDDGNEKLKNYDGTRSS